MIQDRNDSFLHSLLTIFRKTRKNELSEAQDLSVLESRRKIQQRIELALADVNDSAVDHAA
jgi:hypothetical protein